MTHPTLGQAGVAAVPGGSSTRSWTGTVERVAECLVPALGVRRVVVSVREDGTGTVTACPS